MTLLARLEPRPRSRSTRPTYPTALAFAAASALLGACGGVVTVFDQSDPSEPVLAGGAPASYEPDAGRPDTGTGGYMAVHPTPGTGGSPYVEPPSGGVVDAAYVVRPDAGVVIPPEAAPPVEPDAGWPNPAGGEPAPFDPEPDAGR